MNAPQPLFYPQVKQVKEDEELNIRDFLYQYFVKYWYLYLLFTLLNIAAAYCYLQYATPVYEVKSSLLIKEDKDKSASPEDMLMKGLKMFGTSENVANEIHILKSIGLLEQVVQQLQLDVNYHWEYWIKLFPAYKDFPIEVDTFSLSPVILASENYRLRNGFTLQINPLDNERFELLHKEATLGTFQFGTLLTNQYGEFKFNQLQAIPLNSDSLMYVTFKDPALVLEHYLEEININLVEKEASVIELGLKEVAPLRAMDILNLLVELYNKATIDDKNKVSENTLNFLKERLIGIKEELVEVEGNVESYKIRNDISSTSEKDLEIVLKEVSKYTEARTELAVQLEIIESMNMYLGTRGEYQLIPANLSVSSLALKELIEPYNKLVLKRQHLLESATKSNPLVITVEHQLKSLAATIQGTINNIKSDLTKKMNSTASLNNELMSRIKKVPTQERGLLEIKRHQVIKESLYIFLLKKKEETELTLAATTSNARIIDVPRASRKPVTPKKSLVYLGSLLGGLIIPFIFILGKDFLQDTIQGEEDIKMLSKIPIIGSINKTKKNEHIVINSNIRTAIAERFRLIRTNLQFSKRKGTQTILVTSSISGEGKTFISTNLAMSFALAKHKTILLGMDLRKPKVQEYIGKPINKIGVTEYLIGHNTLEEVIQESSLNPNFDYIISGAVPFNPNELLSEHKVAELFERLQEIYDVIIIDTPPVGLVSDAFLLNDFITNCVYVVRSNVTKKQMLVKANELLQKSRLKNASILLNGLNDKGRYGYGESYGYYED